MNDNIFSVSYTKNYFENILEIQITDENWQSFLRNMTIVRESFDEIMFENAMQFFGGEEQR